MVMSMMIDNSVGLAWFWYPQAHTVVWILNYRFKSWAKNYTQSSLHVDLTINGRYFFWTGIYSTWERTEGRTCISWRGVRHTHIHIHNHTHTHSLCLSIFFRPLSVIHLMCLYSMYWKCCLFLFCHIFNHTQAVAVLTILFFFPSGMLQGTIIQGPHGPAGPEVCTVTGCGFLVNRPE